MPALTVRPVSALTVSRILRTTASRRWPHSSTLTKRSPSASAGYCSSRCSVRSRKASSMPTLAMPGSKRLRMLMTAIVVSVALYDRRSVKASFDALLRE